MNWGAGFFRVWLVIAVVWVGGSGVYGFREWQSSTRRAVYEVADPTGLKLRVTAPERTPDSVVMSFAMESETAKRRQAECAQHRGPWCNYPVDIQMPNAPIDWWSLISTALSLPAILLVIGLAARWVYAGFKKPRT